MAKPPHTGGEMRGSYPVFRWWKLPAAWRYTARHKLPRRIFFADQGEFTTGDYEEIMNKASCLSLVSNAILYWNTLKITEIVDDLRAQGEDIAKETLAHISLLPFRHVVPNGMYFIEEV